MGKATRWIRNLLGMKKEPKQPHQSPPLPKDEVEKAGSDLSTTTRSKEKRRWSFGKSVKGAEADRGSERGSGPLVGPKALHNENYGSGPESEQNKHAIAVAAATAAAADAAVAAAHAAAAVVRLTSNGFSFSSGGTHKQEIAATRIQTAFRGYLARKALSALKGLVKLQALVRGHIVRKQAAETLKCMQALIRVQSRVRARRVPKSDEGQAVQAKLLYRQLQKSHLRISDEGRNMSSGILDDMERKVHSRTAAPVKFDRELYSEYHHQEMESSSFDGSAKIVEMDTGRTKLTSKKWMESISDSISVEPSISSTTSASHYPPRPNHVPQSSQRAHSTSHYKSSGAMQASHEMTSQVSRLSIPRPPSDLLTTLTSQDISPYLQYADSGYGEDNTFSTAQSSPQFVNSAVSRHAGKRGPFTPRSEYAESVFEGYSAFPNYMATTQSSKAKVRSQSAPKQRPSSYEKNGLSSRRRMSLQGVVDNRSSISSVRMQRSSSVAPSMRNEYQYPGPFRLDKSTTSQRHDEFDMASIASGGHY